MDEFPVLNVRNSFKGSRYYYEEGIYYNVETEPDCDEQINVLWLALRFPIFYFKHGVLSKRGEYTTKKTTVCA